MRKEYGKMSGVSMNQLTSISVRKHNFIDRTGQRFGRLLVIEFSHITNKKISSWKCLCDCGNIKIIRSSNLLSSSTKSCGCIYKEIWKDKRIGKNNTNYKHGAAIKKEGRTSPEGNSYRDIIAHCYNKNSIGYKYWGGRGITVCDRWLESFENFLDDMGNKPGSEYSIDRFPDKDGNYEPGNCRWATPKEQADNRNKKGYLND